MPNQTTPSRNSVNDALRLSHLLRPDWDETWARIPAWHPRNEVDPAAAAAAAQQQIDWESDENPFKKRYTDTQASYTQNQQELARLKRLEDDPNAYLELGKTKGWVEFEEPSTGQQEQDPYADRWARLDAAEKRLAEHDERISRENAERGEEMFHQDLDTWAKAEGVELSKSDHNAIFGLLMRSPDPTQESAARQIFDAHVADRKSEREALEAEIREQMKRPRAPHIPTGGGAEAGVMDYDSMSTTEINKVMAEQLRAANQR